MKKLTKIILATVIVVCLNALIGVLLITSTEPTVPQQFNLSKHVSIKDSVASPLNAFTTFTLNRSGNYSFYMEWTTPEPGMITGLNVIDENSNYIFSCTAESCTIDTLPFKLDEGTYTVQFLFITSESQLNSFVNDTGIARIQGKEEPVPEPECEPEPYHFTQNAEEEITYHFEVRSKNAYINGKRYGLLAGILFGCLILYIMLLLTKKNDSTKNQFDERQELVRGRGYRLGFITLAGWNILTILLHLFEVPIPAELELQMFFSICLGVFVYTSYCIWHDGYFALNERKGAIAVFMAFVSLLNLIIGIIGIATDRMIADGKLTVTSLNLFAGIICFIIFIEVLAKQLKDKKEEQHEES